MTRPSVHLSIVSHRQSDLVSALLQDLAGVCASIEPRITVLSNVPESPPAVPVDLLDRTECLVNNRPAGFGANHNRVFARCQAKYFCVLNPDLHVGSDPFPELESALEEERVALAAPAAVDPTGGIQDNARKLPNPWTIASKLWSSPRGPDYPHDAGPVYADWVAGFFMLFRSDVFRQLGGFDERYFLYYEDIDLCTRLRLAGWKIAWLPEVRVVHDARRRSHRELKFMLWHLRSMTRFFSSSVYRTARSQSNGSVYR